MKLNLWCSFHHADTALPICLQQTFIRVLICDKRIALFMRYCNEITAVQLTGITQDIDLLHNGEQCFQQTAFHHTVGIQVSLFIYRIHT